MKPLNAEYPFLYETHLHTNRGSACGHNTGWEMAEAAKLYGYAGIVVTEHNWGGNTCIPKSLGWNDWVDEFTKGYYEALEYGEQNDLDVFWGYEAGFDATEFLIYGLTPDWLKTHPEIRDATVEEQFELVHGGGGIVVHAHPFREEYYIPEIRLFPNYVDAVEGVNATHSCHRSKIHNDPKFDERALAYAKKEELPITAGSDVHSTEMLGGGMAFRKRLKSLHDLCDAIVNDGDYILTNGDVWFDKRGMLCSIVNS